METALDVFPAEVWSRIIRVSCSDTSFTARVLSLVSRDIYELSKPYRLQSVSLLGVSRIFAFYKALNSTPKYSSPVVHLFIGCPNLRQENESLRRFAHLNAHVFDVAAELLPSVSPQDHDLPSSPPNSITEVVLGECIQRILTLVGNSLKHLHLHFVGFSKNLELLPDNLTALEHLVLYGAHASYYLEPNTPIHLPSLKKLRIGYHNTIPSQIITRLGTLSPSLIQVSLVLVMVSESHFNDLLDMIKKLDTIWPERGIIPSEVSRKKLILEVDTRDRLGGDASNWYDQLTNIAVTSPRIGIVRKVPQFMDLQNAETEWVAETRKWIEADWVVDSI